MASPPEVVRESIKPRGAETGNASGVGAFASIPVFLCLGKSAEMREPPLNFQTATRSRPRSFAPPPLYIYLSCIYRGVYMPSTEIQNTQSNNAEYLGQSYILDNPLLVNVQDVINNYGLFPEDIKPKFLFILRESFKSFLPLDYKDIDRLDFLFSCYVSVCEYYDYIPMIELFCDFSGVDNYLTHLTNCVFATQEMREASRKAIAALKKWRNKCKLLLINNLANNRGSDVNKIFVAKAVYGVTENQPQTVEDVQRQNAGELLSGLGIECNG